MFARIRTALSISVVLVLANSAGTFAGLAQDGLPKVPASGHLATVPATSAQRAHAVSTTDRKLIVRWEAGTLSVNAERAPLSEVLETVARQTGIEITGGEKLSELVFVRFAGKDLIHALRQLLSHVDYAMNSAGTRVIIVNSAAIWGEATAPREAVPNSPAPPASGQPEPNAGLRNLQPDVQEPASDVQQSNVDAPGNSLQDGDPAVQTAASNLLEDQGKEVAVEGPLANIEDTPQPTQLADVPESAAQEQQTKLASIEKAVSGGDVDALRNSLQDADPAVQAAGFNALAEQGKDAAVEGLLANIKDTSQPVRLQSLQLMVSQGSDEQSTMTVLRNALTDPDPAFSAFAVQELAGRGTPEAIDALRAVLQSADPSLRLLVIQSVAQIQDGAPLLREALSDTDEAVRSAAMTVLSKQLGSTTDSTSKP